MTQRIFDIENEKDMQDLWNIVPDNITKIRKAYKSEEGYFINFYDTNYIEGFYETAFLIINWHGATEITRPVNYEDMIGCVGWFHDEKEFDKKYATMGLLKYYDSTHASPFVDEICEYHWQYFTPAKKSELKFYGD